MSEKRKCMVYHNEKRIKGDFIQYGTKIIYDEGNNPLPMSIAIVETEDGRVLEVEPTNVRFIVES